MSLASRAGDLYYSYRFVKLLTTPWEETDAYKLGLIDGAGVRDKSKKVSSSEEKAAYTTFIRLAFNVKRLLNKVPGGKSTLSSYAAALYLLKETYGFSDKTVAKIMDESGIDPLDLLGEASSWFLLENRAIAPGIYRMSTDTLTLSKGFDHMDVKHNDQVRVYENATPVGDIAGLDVYQATHINSNLPVYITLGDIHR